MNDKKLNSRRKFFGNLKSGLLGTGIFMIFPKMWKDKEKRLLRVELHPSAIKRDKH